MKKYFRTDFWTLKNRQLTKFLVVSAACLLVGLVLLMPSAVRGSSFMLPSNVPFSLPTGSDTLILFGSGLIFASLIFRKQPKG